jgi:hypothetical protein
MDAKKVFDNVFGLNSSGTDLPTEKRGIEVKLTAFDTLQIHRVMVQSYEEMETAHREAQKLSYKLSDARFHLGLALRELECRIHSQEEESGIGGTSFKLFKPLGGENDDDRTTEV